MRFSFWNTTIQIEFNLFYLQFSPYLKASWKYRYFSWLGLHVLVSYRYRPAYYYYYAKDIAKKRTPRYEHCILPSAEHSYLYAKNVIKDRWPEAEKEILKSPHLSYLYARNVLQKRWIQAEPIIAVNDFSYQKYLKFFNIIQKQNWSQEGF